MEVCHNRIESGDISFIIRIIGGEGDLIDCPVANAENLHETICCFGQGASVFLADGRYAVELQLTFALQRVIGKGLFQRALVTVPVVVHALPGGFAVQLKGADRNAREGNFLKSDGTLPQRSL